MVVIKDTLFTPEWIAYFEAFLKQNQALIESKINGHIYMNDEIFMDNNENNWNDEYKAILLDEMYYSDNYKLNYLINFDKTPTSIKLDVGDLLDLWIEKTSTHYFIPVNSSFCKAVILEIRDV